MKRHAAVILGLALTSSAQAIVIDNGIPEGTLGHFSADVQSGGTVTRVLFTTRRFDSPEVVTVSLVSKYQAYVDVGNDGGGFLLEGGPPSSPFGGLVSSDGSFEGEHGTVFWSAFSSIAPNEKRLFTNYNFSSVELPGFPGPPLPGPPPPPIGTLRVFQYLDGDLSDGGDVLRIRGPGRELETLDNSNLFGVALAGDFLSCSGGAADVFNNIVPRILGDGQATSPDITIANLPPFVHPELGPVRGPGDVVSVIACDPVSFSPEFPAFVSDALGVVAPPPDPRPSRDSDGDGVPNPSDRCPGTLAGVLVQPDGCPFPDSDGDGVQNPNDDCSATPAGTPVQPNGCPVLDFDGDGVPDSADNCTVVSNPTQVDVDGDGTGDVCDVTNPVPSIVNRKNVPCRGKKCDVKLACPTRPNSVCKNTAVITVDRKFLRAPPASRVSLSGRAPRKTIQMAAGATSVPPGAVGVIQMNINKKGRRVIDVNRGNTIPGKMNIFNSAGERLSSTRIMMKISNTP